MQTRSGSCSQHDSRFMCTSSCLQDLLTLLDSGFRNLIWFRLDYSDFSIAAKLSQPPMNAFRTSKAGVEDRHSIETALSNAQIASARVNAIQNEWFQCSICATMSH